MRKVVVNCCFGGFSLSMRGTAMLAKLKGRKCYFFKTDYSRTEAGELDRYVPFKVKIGESDLFWNAFDIPNPNKVLGRKKCSKDMTDKEIEAANKLYGDRSIYYGDISREDPLLIKVVEELGKEADGRCAELKVIEIPDGVKYHIAEYDGNEHVAEDHRTWP